MVADDISTKVLLPTCLTNPAYPPFLPFFLFHSYYSSVGPIMVYHFALGYRVKFVTRQNVKDAIFSLFFLTSSPPFHSTNLTIFTRIVNLLM